MGLAQAWVSRASEAQSVAEDGSRGRPWPPPRKWAVRPARSPEAGPGRSLADGTRVLGRPRSFLPRALRPSEAMWARRKDCVRHRVSLVHGPHGGPRLKAPRAREDGPWTPVPRPRTPAPCGCALQVPPGSSHQDQLQPQVKRRARPCSRRSLRRFRFRLCTRLLPSADHWAPGSRGRSGGAHRRSPDGVWLELPPALVIGAY